MDKIDKNNRLKTIPKIDKILSDINLQNIPKNILIKIANNLFDSLRQDETAIIDYDNIITTINSTFINLTKSNMRRVINATGILIHTNLGRSPISRDILLKSIDDLDHYVTLEYDLITGKRSERNSNITLIFNYLTDSEDMILVNNNAGAVFLILNTFANKKNVLVSRSEIIEIGGKFRLPDMMKKAGAKLIEVGCTNKTYITDYATAIDNKTAILMKASKSNYTINGFINEVSYKDIAELAEEKNLISFYDAGSSYIIKNDALKNIDDLKTIITSGIDIVSFSADKLFGSIQAGIIIGRKKYIEKLKANPIMRILRLDKLRQNIIINTMNAYISNDHKNILIHNIIARDYNNLKNIATKIISSVDSRYLNMSDDEAFYGGGVCPSSKVKSISIAITIDGVTAEKIAEQFRACNTPIIGHIRSKKYLINLYTVQDDEVEELIENINSVIDKVTQK